jgi:biotin transport system substrate-specific component
LTYNLFLIRIFTEKFRKEIFMQINGIMDNYNRLWFRFFKWRSGLAVVKKIMLAFGGACLMGVLAQLKIALPWTPVPIVGSTLGVVLAGTLMGRWWGGVSAVIYIACGMAGLPWFAGFTGGLSVVLGPTGGYLIGFVLASLFVGHMIDRSVDNRRLLPLFGIMLFAHLVLMYVPGLVQLGFWLSLVKKQPVSLGHLLLIGAIPFIAGDVVKSIAGSLLVNGIIPKKPYFRS